MQKLTIFLLTALLFILITACGATEEQTMDDQTDDASANNVSTEIDTQLDGDDDTIVATEDSSTDQVITIEEPTVDPVQPPALPETASPALLDELPPFDESDVQETATGLQYVIYEEGSGDTPNQGDTIVAHYTGYLTDGTVFDSSVERGVPFNFTLGRGEVIPGWDQGFALMNPGSKAILIIPPILAYGPAGQGSIPPNATLYFDVELVDVIEPRVPQVVDPSDYTVDDSGVEYYDFVVGDGDEAVVDKVVEINFALWDSSTLELIGSSDEIGQPLSFRIGGGQMFQALQDGVIGMKVGGSRQIYIPGALLQDANLPQESDIIFEVELVNVREGGPSEPTEIDEEDFTELDDGIRYADIETGDGIELVGGFFVIAEYTAWLEDGTLFDSSIDSGQPLQFAYGQAPIPGFNEGLVDITVGTTRQIYVPAEVIGNPELGNILFEVVIVSAEAP